MRVGGRGVHRGVGDQELIPVVGIVRGYMELKCSDFAGNRVGNGLIGVYM